MQRTIVITGGAGLVGRNLIRCALEKGYRVIAVDTRDRLRRLEDIEMHSDARLLFSPLNLVENQFTLEVDADALIHLAALPHVDYSRYYPDRVVTNNITALLEPIHVALERNIPLLFSSSVEVYGGNEGALFTETDAYTPLSPYAASKVGCEAFIQSSMSSFGLTASIIRFTNLYGP
jgi:dTDP-glucose 4,6-dehydratase